MKRSQTQNKTSPRRARTSVLRWLAFTMLGLGWLAGAIACSNTVQPPVETCQSNQDCPGSAVCQDGACVVPVQESTPAEATAEVSAEPSSESTTSEPSKEASKEPETEAPNPTEPPAEAQGDASESLPEDTESPSEEAPETDLPEDSISCVAGQTRPCYTGDPTTDGEGVCTPGKQNCKGGYWDIVCEGEVLPSREECNGKDDNCDGQVDETFPGKDDVCKVTGKLGPCAQGNNICDQGKVVCQSAYKPQQEDCGNKVDDDCDGKVDGPPCVCNSGDTRDCFSGDPNQANQGECRKGRQSCTSGQWGDCKGEQLPAKEECNGKDDNCNGQIDEDFPEKNLPCTDTSKQGICKQGVYSSCTSGKLVCKSTVSPAATEICNNGKDDNCNGDIDENPPCQCRSGQTRSCYSGNVGTDSIKPCQRGQQTCGSNGQWGACKGEVTPKPEACDNIDNDCNGSIDESLQRTCKSSCGSGIEVCRGGKWTGCTAPQPVAEVCDGKDNDCDGYIDNKSGVKQKDTLTQTCSNRCGKGSESCSNGQWVNCSAPNATTEVCDGKDNDCDGTIDDNIRVECFDARGKGCVYSSLLRRWTCKGECQTGYRACVRGVLSKVCTGDVVARTEICRDRKDNDCDGSTDEICGPFYTYAHVSSSGSLSAGRYISTTSQTSTGTYSITPTFTGYGCGSRPIFVTTSGTSAMRPVSFSCTSSTTFKVNMGSPKTTTGARSNASFYAVIPTRATGAIWGRIFCTSTTCRSSASYGSFTATYVSKGVTDISSTYCQDANAPVFATIYSSGVVGYAVAYIYNKKCRIRRYNLKGELTDLSFAFWVPNKSTAAWSIVSSSGSITASNNFSDAYAKWTSSQTTSSSVYQYTNVSFPAYNSQSTAVLVSPRIGLPYHAGVLRSTSSIRVYTHKIADGTNVTMNVAVLFVQ